MGSRRHSQLVIDYICEYYPNTQTSEMAKVLGISENKIHQIANVRGIKKTKQYIRELHGKRVAILGEKHRYAKGSTPWNKGVKGIKHAPEHTLFKPGHMPANYKPVGWTRVDEEGYTWMKVREGKFAWDMIHRVVWETENGPIPKGKFLRFKDGNKANWELDNRFAAKRSLNNKINYMNEIENTIKKAQDEALNKLRLGAVSGSHYPMLLMASYCGGDNSKCTDELPCEDCLKMSNIVLIPKNQVKSENIISGYDFLNDCR